VEYPRRVVSGRPETVSDRLLPRDDDVAAASPSLSMSHARCVSVNPERVASRPRWLCGRDSRATS